MKRTLLAATAAVAAFVAAAPASAAVYVQSLGVISTPPDAFRGPSTVVDAGDVTVYYNFRLTSDLTLSSGSVTSTAPNAVQFASLGLYSGTFNETNAAPTGTPITMNLIQETGVNGSTSIGTAPTTLRAGAYSFALTGTAAAQNAVGTSFRFSAAAVPEPATWGLMLMGFGMVGFGLRSRKQARVAFG